MKTCVTHHFACDCSERGFSEQKRELDDALITIKKLERVIEHLRIQRNEVIKGSPFACSITWYELQIDAILNPERMKGNE